MSVVVATPKAKAQNSSPAASGTSGLPDAPAQGTSPLQVRKPPSTPEEVEELRKSQLPYVNGAQYDYPSKHDFFINYLRDTYGLPGQARSFVQTSYAQARGKPTGWGTDVAGFGQRLGSAEAISAINGTMRYGLETLFHEDLRYLPCHGCSAKHKLENALLSEVTARHDDNGKRFFTLTPAISDFSGPIVVHTLWYPGAASGPLSGVVSVRTVVATRVGAHLFREFILERRHIDKPEAR